MRLRTAPIPLLLVIALGATATAPPALAAEIDVRRTRERLARAMESEKWEKAVALAETLVAAEPENPSHVYNLACALAERGAPDEAMAALRRAAELNFSFVTTSRTDSDLDAIRSHPEFADVAAAIEANHARQFAEYKAVVDKSRPLVLGPESGEMNDPLPLLILLHGRGGKAHPLAERWLEPAREAGVVMIAPESPVPLGAGFQWESIDNSVYQVRQAIEYAAALFPVDRERVIVGGFSQGAYLALAAAARHPSLFSGVVAIGACVRDGVELDRIPEGHGLGVYIGAGSEDRIHPECRPMSKRYREAGFDVKTRTYSGYGHVFPPNYKWEFARALEHVLPAETQEKP